MGVGGSEWPPSSLLGSSLLQESSRAREGSHTASGREGSHTASNLPPPSRLPPPFPENPPTTTVHHPRLHRSQQNHFDLGPTFEKNLFFLPGCLELEERGSRPPASPAQGPPAASPAQSPPASPAPPPPPASPAQRNRPGGSCCCCKTTGKPPEGS